MENEATWDGWVFVRESTRPIDCEKCGRLVVVERRRYYKRRGKGVASGMVELPRPHECRGGE